MAALGRARAAAWVLLEQLREAGADFDWTSRANAMARRLDAWPWRMDTATLTAHACLPGSPLSGKPVVAALDARLYEEQLLHPGSREAR